MTRIAGKIAEGSAPSRLRHFLSKPVLGPVLRDRKTSLGMAILAVLQVAAALNGWRTIECPMLQSTGLPCPGCGLSRACGAFIRGDWHAWTTWHVFAPLFLLAAAMMLAALLLPNDAREWLARLTDGFERRLAIVPVTLITMVVYWAGRLLYSGSSYIALMRG